MLTAKEAQVQLVALTEASGALWKAMKANSAAFHAFHYVAWPRCTERAEDGERCVLTRSQHEEPINAKEHISDRMLHVSPTPDSERPYKLIAGRPLTIPYTWSLDEVPMIPVSIKYEDGSTVGSRCVAWIRTADVGLFPNVIVNGEGQEES